MECIYKLWQIGDDFLRSLVGKYDYEEVNIILYIIIVPSIICILTGCFICTCKNKTIKITLLILSALILLATALLIL